MKKNRISFICNSFKSFFQLLPFCFKKAEEGKAKVIIRFDDYGVWCNSDWITIENEIIRLHEKYQVKISFGVIPDSIYPLIAHPLSPSVYPEKYENLESNTFPLVEGSPRVNILKECVKKGIAEVTMHGYSHPKGYSNVNNSEFYGLPYDTQYNKLQKGKNKLEELFECSVTTFIPPHNTYDNLTLNLLTEFGFKCISAKYVVGTAPRCDRLNLNYLWFRYDDLSVFFRDIAKKKHYKYDPVIVIMLHHTNFTTEGRIDRNKLNDYERILSYIKENNIENFNFNTLPEFEVKISDAAYKQREYSLLSRVVRKYLPSIASNYTKNMIINSK